MTIGWLSVGVGASISIYGAITFQGSSLDILKKRERYFWIGSAVALTALADNKNLGVLAGKAVEALPSIPLPVLAGKEPLFLPSEGLDMKTLDDVTDANHLLIIGSTGSGKSTLASALIRKLGGTATVLDPHAASHDWVGFSVIGRERNYAAIARMMESQLQELNRRYSLRSQGKPYGDVLNIIVDEFPSITASSECKAIAPKWLQSIGCEARKVGMRLVVLSQGQTVKSLGIEGQGELRSNFTFIRLGTFAIDHAKHLKRQAVSSWLGLQERPAMLDDSPLEIPVIEGATHVVTVEVPSVTVTDTELSSSNGSTDVTSSVTDLELWLLCQPYIGSKSHSWIIKNVLKMGGRQYEQGKAKLTDLIERYGR